MVIECYNDQFEINKFLGPIPHDIGEKMPNIIALDTSQNPFKWKHSFVNGKPNWTDSLGSQTTNYLEKFLIFGEAYHT